MFSVNGSRVLSLATVGLSSSVELNVFDPMVIFILPSEASLVTWALLLTGSEASVSEPGRSCRMKPIQERGPLSHKDGIAISS